MTLYERSCQNCGGNLAELSDGKFKCEYCGSIFTSESVEKNMEELHRLFDETKREAIANARKNLYDAVSAEYISSTLVHECAMALKQHLPDDFQANFYELAIGNNPRKLAKAIRRLNVVENASCLDLIVRFLILSLQSEFVTEVGDLIERAYKMTDLVKFEKYSTDLSVEAEKIDNCIYMTSYPRDVFVAYSSKDMERVMELVECLEEQGLSCFVAARNLRHGKGAVENYEAALHEAMDNCQSFVFVSSTNSRHPGCDALKREIPYIKNRDLEGAPATLRHDYAGIPHKYKKHRVEYRIEESLRPMAADRAVSDFFNGYERVYSPLEVADRVLNRPVVFDDEPEKAEPTPAPTVVKETVIRDSGSGANTDALLKRAFMALEDGEFDRADEFSEMALNQDPENAEAYLAKLMTELRVKNRADLKNCQEPFTDKNNYKKVLRFATPELKAEVEGYIKHINDRIAAEKRRVEEERLEKLYRQSTAQMNAAESEEDFIEASRSFASLGAYKDSAELSKRCLALAEETRLKELEALYNSAKSKMEAAVKETEYDAAAKSFKAIYDYKDSAELYQKCLEFAENIRQNLEQQKKQERLAAELKAQRRRKATYITISIISVLIIFALIFTNIIMPAIKYRNAVALVDKGKYNEAIDIFKELDGYKDSLQKIRETENEKVYSNALTLMNNKKYSEAINKFKTLNGYKDSINKISECQTAINDATYDDALSLMADGKYTEAIAIFESLNGHKDSSKKISECQTAINDATYDDALSLMADGKYTEAIAIFESLNGHKDSSKKISECQTAINDATYNDALSLMAEGKYVEAKAIFESLNGYKDSALKIEECSLKIPEYKYSSAVSLLEDGYFVEALEIFESEELDNYKDVADLITQCKNYCKLEFVLKDDGYVVSGLKASVTNVIIPSKYQGLTVTGIASSAFKNKTDITSITIPNSVTSIGNDAFYGCSSLTSIAIPDSVTSIGSHAFSVCSSLTNITIPDSVTSIDFYAFGGCSNLKTVYYTGNESDWSKIEIDYGNSNFKNAIIDYNYKE